MAAIPDLARWSYMPLALSAQRLRITRGRAVILVAAVGCKRVILIQPSPWSYSM